MKPKIASLPSFLQSEVFPYFSIEIVRDVELVDVLIEDDAQAGDACSAACGHCGRCSSGPSLNAQCSDCGAGFWKGREDIGSLCDACCDARDAHTAALQRRLTDVALTAVKAALAKKAGAA